MNENKRQRERERERERERVSRTKIEFDQYQKEDLSRTKETLNDFEMEDNCSKTVPFWLVQLYASLYYRQKVHFHEMVQLFSPRS